ncbi:MAG: helix-turn-helix transcriptional regulator [Schleiferiaceae bacterium]
MDIQKLTQALDTTTSNFAEEIGVSRPIISHIQNGRNKPSLAVIQKISERYPQVSLDWLVHGKGPILFKNETPSTRKPEEETSSPTLEDTMVSASEPQKETVKPTHPKGDDTVKGSDKQTVAIGPSDPIVKIVHYYASGTFEEFRPKTLGTQEE